MESQRNVAYIAWLEAEHPKEIRDDDDEIGSTKVLIDPGGQDQAEVQGQASF